jgi:hypothetical protein
MALDDKPVSGRVLGPADAERRRLNEWLRAEYVAGAEEEWRRRTGRSMTAEELERVLRRYPGDVPNASCPDHATGVTFPDVVVTPLQYAD